MLLVGFLSVCSLGLPLQAQLKSGPMVGHTTHNTAQIWALASAGETVEIAYRPAGGDSSQATTLAMPPDSDKNFRSLIELTGLEASTAYEYEVNVNGSKADEGGFTTAALPHRPGTFRYMVASCMDLSVYSASEQSAWDAVLEQEPDFNLLVGDNVYANSTGYDRLWAFHRSQRKVPNFAEVIRTAPTYAVWDDHDFGPNNSHGGTPGKQNSLRAFKDVWANPSYGTEEIPGIFTSFYRGNVHFIFLDGRYHRTDEKAPNSDSKTQFGEPQRQWLYQTLRESKSTFKVLVSGFDFMSRPYSNEVRIMAEEIGRDGIYGIVFHSGDIHRNEFKQQDHGMGYPMTQFVSSGIAKNINRPWAMVDVNTTLEDPTFTTRFYHNRTLVESKTIRLSELIPAGLSDLILNSPLGGERIEQGSTHTIAWTKIGTGIAQVNLEYSTGAAWKPIAASVANTGSYAWTVPDEISNSVKVRITSADGEKADESRGVFTIGRRASEGTAVEEETATAAPGSFNLEQNYPNPFNSNTVIRFSLARDLPVRLRIYNLAGQQVASLVDEDRAAGPYEARWDGRSDTGKVLPSGTYLYELQAGDLSSTRKLVLLR